MQELTPIFNLIAVFCFGAAFTLAYNQSKDWLVFGVMGVLLVIPNLFVG